MDSCPLPRATCHVHSAPQDDLPTSSCLQIIAGITDETAGAGLVTRADFVSVMTARIQTQASASAP